MMPSVSNNCVDCADDIRGNAVIPGNELMPNGGTQGAVNDDRLIILKHRIPQDKDRNKVYKRELSFIYYPVVNGDVVDEQISNHLRVSDYDGKRLLRKGKPISFLGVYKGLFSIAVPVTVRLSDGADLRGSVDISLRCDLKELGNLLNNMIGSFCREYDEGFELVQELTAKNVVEVVGGNVCECVSEVMRGFDQPQTDHNTICGRIFAKIDEDVGINSRGFRIERLCVNFERTHDERLRQLLGESRFRMRQQEINVDETTYMMDLTRKEYRAVRGV